MFGIDFSEILVIFGIALVVLGPERLPKLAATIGRWIGRARAMARQFREQLEQETNGLHQSMDLGPEFGGRRAPAPASPSTPSTPTIRPPAHSMPASPEAPDVAHGAPPTPSPPVTDISMTDLTSPTPLSGTAGDTAMPPGEATPSSDSPLQHSFEYGLAHTHPAALHPATTSPPPASVSAQLPAEAPVATAPASPPPH